MNQNIIPLLRELIMIVAILVAVSCMLLSTSLTRAESPIQGEPLDTTPTQTTKTHPIITPNTSQSTHSNSSQNTEQQASTEENKKAYGVDVIWQEGDLVAKGTLMIMLIMSIGSWYLILLKCFQQFKMMRQAKHSREKFSTALSLSEGIDQLEPNTSYRYLAERAYHSNLNYTPQMLEKIEFNTWITLSIQQAVEKSQSQLSSGLAFLATVGSTAPFIGLFGTVWGIYHALTVIGISGQASIDKVAGPVGEALIMTAIGLAVAVPAVLGYNWLVRRNKAVLDDLRSFGSDLHSIVLSGNMHSIKSTQPPLKFKSVPEES